MWNPEMGPNPGESYQSSGKNESGAHEKHDSPISVRHAIQKERSVLERFRGRARDIAKILLLTTTCAVGGLAVEQRPAFAQDRPGSSDRQKPGETGSEKSKTPEQQAQEQQELAFSFVQDLESIKVGMDTESDAMEARDLIYAYALLRQGKSQGQVGPRQVWEGVQELARQALAYEDEKFGNHNDKMDPEEYKSFVARTEGSTGLQQLREMYQQYGEMFKTSDNKPSQ